MSRQANQREQAKRQSQAPVASVKERKDYDAAYARYQESYQGAQGAGKSEATFEYDGNFSFILPNETSNRINLAGVRPFEKCYEKLFEAARRVRSQNLFGSNISALIRNDLVKRYSFKPFEYQIENVLAVLNRYDGKAVLGDQVGLGKTVEALMTADAMFACGVIRNALIIVPKRMLRDWRAEISSKFNGVFNICNEKAIKAYLDGDKAGSARFFSDTIEAMYADNRKTEEELLGGAKSNAERERLRRRLYIIVDEMIGENVVDVKDIYSQIDYINKIIEGGLSEGDERILGKRIEEGKEPRPEELGELERKIMNIAEPGLDFNMVVDVFKEYGYYDASSASMVDFEGRLEMVSGDRGCKCVLAAMNREKCERVRGILERYRKRYEALYHFKKKTYRERAAEDYRILRDWLDGIEAEFKRRTELFNRNTFGGLFLSGEKRLVDLLIVDEVHSFYNNNSGKNVAEDVFDFEEQALAISLLSEMKKKFCVLMSATPVRTRLEDIFDLIWIADKDRFGTTREIALQYFYTTMCRLPVNEYNRVDEKYKLSLMMDYPELRKSLFGLINNFFTRKRISEVSDDLCGVGKEHFAAKKAADPRLSGLVYSKLTAPERAVVDEAYQDIKTSRALIHLQQNDSDREASEEMAEMGLEAWKRSDLSRTLDYHDSEDERKTDYSLIQAAINRVLIDRIEAGRYSQSDTRTVHSLVNWNRRGKEGILIDVGFGADAAAAIRRLKDVRSGRVAPNDRAAFAASLLECIMPERRDGWKDDPIAPFCVEADRYLNAIANEPILIFDSRVAPGPSNAEFRERFELRLRDALDSNIRADRGRGVASRRIVFNPYAEHAIDAGCHNQVSVVDKSYQAGVNLQQYRVLIFSQMDVDGERLMEPVDVEQWIGRVHRTAQVKDCLIITVPAVNIEGIIDPKGKDSVEKQKADFYGFLKWYYSVLSDPEGLDLYGNNTPDVAFIQPIVVDKLKMTISRIMEERSNEKARFNNIVKDHLRLIKPGQTVDDLSFSQLLELCYKYESLDVRGLGFELKDMVIGMIRSVCRTEGLGKRKGE